MDNLTFDKILDLMLKSLDDDANIDVDALIAEVVKKLGVSDETKQKIERSSDFLQTIESNYQDLLAAKEQSGLSNGNWLNQHILTKAQEKGLSEEDREKLVGLVGEAVEKETQALFKSEEE